MGWRNRSDLAAPSARFYKGFAAGVQEATEGRPPRQLVPGLYMQPGELPQPGAIAALPARTRRPVPPRKKFFETYSLLSPL